MVIDAVPLGPSRLSPSVSSYCVHPLWQWWPQRQPSTPPPGLTTYNATYTHRIHVLRTFFPKLQNYNFLVVQYFALTFSYFVSVIWLSLFSLQQLCAFYPLVFVELSHLPASQSVKKPHYNPLLHNYYYKYFIIYSICTLHHRISAHTFPHIISFYLPLYFNVLLFISIMLKPWSGNQLLFILLAFSFTSLY